MLGLRPADRQIAPKRFLAIIVAAALAGCAVTLISSYDETTDRDTTSLEKSVDALVRQLDANPVPAYGQLQPQFEQIRIDFNALRLRNEARPKNSQTVKQLDDLRVILDTLESVEKRGQFIQVMVGPTRDALNQTFRAILKLELEKKALNKTE